MSIPHTLRLSLVYEIFARESFTLLEPQIESSPLTYLSRSLSLSLSASLLLSISLLSFSYYLSSLSFPLSFSLYLSSFKSLSAYYVSVFLFAYLLITLLSIYLSTCLTIALSTIFPVFLYLLLLSLSISFVGSHCSDYLLNAFLPFLFVHHYLSLISQSFNLSSPLHSHHLFPNSLLIFSSTHSPSPRSILFLPIVRSYPQHS